MQNALSKEIELSFVKFDINDINFSNRKPSFPLNNPNNRLKRSFFFVSVPLFVQNVTFEKFNEENPKKMGKKECFQLQRIVG